jgi:uncharacterized SAM-binding protein YcdF (DUF218 family)
LRPATRARSVRARMRALLVVALALAAGGAALAWNAARWLVVADPLPAHADAIVVLAGSPSDRALEAARLWQAGVAPIVVTAREELPKGAAPLRARGVYLPESHELLTRALVGLGVPGDRVHVLARRTTNTRTEANAIARWACATRVRALVVVTSPSHTRRARLLLRAALGPGIALAVRPAPAAHFVTSAWWRNRRSAKLVLSEWEKLANWAISERWAMRPCGGLRRRPPRAALPATPTASPQRG